MMIRMVICDVSDYIPFISKYFEFLYTILHAHCVPKINRWKVPFSDRYHAINVIAVENYLLGIKKCLPTSCRFDVK